MKADRYRLANGQASFLGALGFFAVLVLLVVMYTLRVNDTAEIRQSSYEGCVARNHNAQIVKAAFQEIAADVGDAQSAARIRALAGELETPDCGTYLR